jgi:hypothetical protein
VTEFGGTQKITIDFSGAMRSDVTLKVSIESQTALYGTDYTTNPDGSSSTISIPVAKGATNATFDFTPVQRTTVQAPRIVTFVLTSTGGVQPGDNASLAVTITDDGDVVQFAKSSQAITKFAGAQKITINFPTPPATDVTLSISVKDSTSVYGQDYTTQPDGSSGTITLQVPKGSTSITFNYVPVVSMTIVPMPTVIFKISGQSAGMHLGAIPSTKVTLLDNDLVCYLPMNGNTRDASFLNSSTSFWGTASLTTGRKSLPNTAYNMNGTTNAIQISNSTALDTLQNLTLTAWIKPISFAGNGNNAIIEKAYYSHNNPYYQYKLGITGDQHLNVPASFVFSLSINGSYQVIYTTANAWTPGNWYFVSGVYDGKNMVLYVNGAVTASLPIVGKVDHYGTDLFVAYMNNPGLYTPGTFGDIRIYNKALTAAQITTLYAK